MTSPSLYRGKERLSAPAGGPKQWIVAVLIGTLAGGIVAAAVSFLARKSDLATGFFFGSVLSALNFYSLKTLTEKVLSPADPKGLRRFWFWNIVRWIFFVLACWFLLLVSKLCLLGAVSSYLWFLAVLGWVGFRSASFPPPPRSGTL